MCFRKRTPQDLDAKDSRESCPKNDKKTSGH